MDDFEDEFQEKQLYNKFKFKCVKGCDYCCKLNDIALYPFDIMELCRHLGLTSKEFHQRYSRFEFDTEARILRCYLITTPNCVFFDKHEACIVYDFRPIRCRLFPVGRIFNRNGSIGYYLPKEKCIGFDSGKKHSIQEWIESSGVNEKDDMIKEWNAFINELKNNKELPLTDEFFIMMFKKIFYDFDNELANVIKDEPNVENNDLKARMDKLYNLARVYLFHIEKWKKHYEENFRD